MTLPAALAVVIPARDEEQLLPACLDSVASAIDTLTVAHPTITCRAFVVLDSCLDRTADVVAARPAVTGVPAHVGQVGAARAAGVLAAAEWSQTTDPSQVWISNTDADTVVPTHWLTVQVALAWAGNELVVGTVQPRPKDLSAPEHALWRERHSTQDGHEHVHGASMGFSLAAYHRAGGFPHLPVHEDVELVRALQGARIDWFASGGIEVVTSGRRSARAPHGFAAYLDGLGA